MRIPTEIFRGEIVKRIYPDKQDNEITKSLITELHNAKKMKILEWIPITEKIKSEDNNQEYINLVENLFYCSAYNCMCTIIRKTQTKDDLFVRFLFYTDRKKKYIFYFIIY